MMRGSDFLQKLPSLREWCTADREVPAGTAGQRQGRLITLKIVKGSVEKERDVGNAQSYS